MFRLGLVVMVMLDGSLGDRGELTLDIYEHRSYNACCLRTRPFVTVNLSSFSLETMLYYSIQSRNLRRSWASQM